MGIKNLHKFIKKNYPENIENIDLSLISGKILAIDTPWLVYKYKMGFPNAKNSLEWLNFLIKLIIYLSHLKIKIIFVFEGESEIEKSEERIKRRENIKKLNEKTDLLEKIISKSQLDNKENETLQKFWQENKLSGKFDLKKIKKIILKRNKYRNFPSKTDFDELEILLKLMNITIIYSKNESETTCCFLKKINKIDFVCSGDSDILAYIGIDKVISNFNLKDKTCEIINKKLLLKNLEFSEEKFIDFCILCGTDYNKTKKGCGLSSSLKIVKNNKQFLDLSEEEYFDYNIEFIRNKFIFSNNNIENYIKNEIIFENININLESILDRYPLFYNVRLQLINYEKNIEEFKYILDIFYKKYSMYLE